MRPLSPRLRWGWPVFGLVLLLALPARAEIWGYVDQRGVSHFSDRQLDRRYKLFYRGGKATSSRPLGMAPGAAGAPARIDASFEVSTAFKAVRHLIREAASASGVEYELLKAVIATESGFNANAVSPRGAIGLMQLMPETAARFGVRSGRDQTLEQRLTDPRTNLHAGARYLAWLIKTFDGELDLALAAYNAGEGAVLRAGRQVPNFRETRDYVRKVTQLHQNLLPPRAVRQLRSAQRPRDDAAARPAVPAL